MDPLAPYRPTPDDPFDPAKAALLARRAGFGATPEQIDRLVALGFEGAVERFVDAPEVDGELESELERLGGEFPEPAGGDAGPAVEGLRRWWIYRMVRARHPLREKLTLLWHDHFATQESKVVRAALLLTQNRTLRRLATAPFRELLGAVARDPAMLVYLDNRISVKENPNENWARELMELFSLGLDRYTQRDVTELARIFTGWSTPTDDAAEFVFRADDHDDGDKELLGHVIRGRAGDAGLEEGEEALDVLVSQPACPRFLAETLTRWFHTDDPDPDWIDALAAHLSAHDLSIREGVRAILSSAAFYDPARRFARHRHPIDMVVGAARSLDLQNPHLAGLETFARRMGMRLFEPPSVAGWQHGAAWAGSGTVLPRVQFGLGLSGVAHSRRVVTGQPAFDLDRVAGRGDAGAESALDLDALLDRVSRRLLARRLDGARREVIRSCLGELTADLGGAGSQVRRPLARALLHLLVATPEFAME